MPKKLENGIRVYKIEEYYYILTEQNYSESLNKNNFYLIKDPMNQYLDTNDGLSPNNDVKSCSSISKKYLYFHESKLFLAILE